MQESSLPTKSKAKNGLPKKKLAIVLSVVLALAVVIGVVSIFTPSKEELSSRISDELSSSRKYSESYTSFGFVNVFVGNDEASKVDVSETYLGFAGKGYEANDGALGIIADFIRWIPVLLSGCGVTVSLTIVSVITGLIGSLFLALGKISKNKVIEKICDAYIFFFRGTPLLMQLYFIYYALPLISPSLTISNRFLAAYIAFSMNSAAYCAEIIRAAIQSIDKGQFEGASSIGMSHVQAMLHVILPQVLRNILPSVSNEFVINIKDTSVLNVIGVTELYYFAGIIKRQSFQTFQTYLVVCVIYFILTFTVTRLLRFVESKLDGDENYTIFGSQSDSAAEIHIKKEA